MTAYNPHSLSFFTEENLLCYFNHCISEQDSFPVFFQKRSTNVYSSLLIFIPILTSFLSGLLGVKRFFERKVNREQQSEKPIESNVHGLVWLAMALCII